MSKLADVAYDIEQLYIEGYRPTSIAAQLDIPLSMVYDWLESVGVAEDPEFEVPDELTDELTDELAKIVDGWVRLTVAEKQQEIFSPFQTSNS